MTGIFASDSLFGTVVLDTLEGTATVFTAAVLALTLVLVVGAGTSQPIERKIIPIEKINAIDFPTPIFSN
ncbi:MAG TPA: hypothetical protein VGP58_03690 [Pyrinomonadaceae bacterium]|nr:hypothetical protein [Pyrinomonadaceae bacterium]